MALQTSGAISLNQIHIEAGGTSGTQVSLNDSDIRAVAGSASGAVEVDDCYGATVVAVTQGIKYQTMATLYGYSDSVSIGSVSPSSVTGSSISNMTLKTVYRVSSSSGLFLTVDVSYSSANAISASEFTRISLVANGTVTNLLTSEAQSSTLGGGYIRRWTWSSSYGLDSTEISNLTTEFDGSGTIDVTFKP